MMLSQFYAILPLLASLALAGNLQIKQDTSVSATKGHKDGQYVWTSIADLEKKDKITDGELVKIAHEASLEMRASWDSAPKAKRPSVMTVMEIDNQLYMASSMKGDYSFIYEYKTNNGAGKTADGTVRKSVPKEIAEALGSAQSAGSSANRNNVQHKNDASCGELMASYTYLLKNSGQSLKNKKPKRTVAWLHTTDRDGKTATDKAWDPCGTDDGESWGCDLFCNKMNFDAVKVTTAEAKDLPKIAKTTQQTLMTPELRKELDAMNKETDDANKKKQQEQADKKKKEKEEKAKKEQEEKEKNQGKDDKKDDKAEKKEDKKEDKAEKKEDKKDDKKSKKGGKRGVTARSWSA